MASFCHVCTSIVTQITQLPSNGNRGSGVLQLNPLSMKMQSPGNLLQDQQIKPLFTRQQKITDKLANLKDVHFSIECVPSRISNANALELISQLSEHLVFVAITWHAKHDQNSPIESTSIKLAKAILTSVKPPPDLLMHLTCIGQTKEEIKRILNQLIQLGICNLLIIRGDESADSKSGDFSTAFELVSFVRSCYGNYFAIGVAGYPDQNTEDDWQCLAEKAQLSDFIVTQLFLQADSFVTFVARCKQRGINLPIIPGVMPIHSPEAFNFISRLTALPIPNEITTALKDVEYNGEGLFHFGVETITNICKAIKHRTNVIHIFSRNKKDHTVLILQKLGLIC